MWLFSGKIYYCSLQILVTRKKVPSLPAHLQQKALFTELTWSTSPPQYRSVDSRKATQEVSNSSKPILTGKMCTVHYIVFLCGHSVKSCTSNCYPNFTCKYPEKVEAEPSAELHYKRCFHTPELEPAASKVGQYLLLRE